MNYATAMMSRDQEANMAVATVQGGISVLRFSEKNSFIQVKRKYLTHLVK